MQVWLFEHKIQYEGTETKAICATRARAVKALLDYKNLLGNQGWVKSGTAEKTIWSKSDQELQVFPYEVLE